MAAYVAAAHLGSPPVRIVGRATGQDGADPTGWIERGAPGFEELRAFRTLASEEVGELWAAICEAWSQTTFYLFDPDSWR